MGISASERVISTDRPRSKTCSPVVPVAMRRPSAVLLLPARATGGGRPGSPVPRRGLAGRGSTCGGEEVPRGFSSRSACRDPASVSSLAALVSFLYGIRRRLLPCEARGRLTQKCSEKNIYPTEIWLQTELLGLSLHLGARQAYRDACGRTRLGAISPSDRSPHELRIHRRAGPSSRRTAQIS